MDVAAADRWSRRQLCCALLRSVSSMLLMPVTPGVLRSMFAADEAAARVAAHQADLAFYGALVQLVLGPVAGALGDGAVGRKPILLACGVLQVAGAVAVAAARAGFIGVATLKASQLLGQVAAITTMTTTTACVGDAYASDKSKVAAAAGKLGGLTMGMGMLVGPALGAALAKVGGPDLVCNLAIAGLLAALLGQAATVPETRQTPRRTASWLDACLKPVKAVAVLWSNGPKLRWLAAAAFFAALNRGESAIYGAYRGGVNISARRSPSAPNFAALERASSGLSRRFMMDVWGAGPGGLAATMTVVGFAFAASQALLVKPLVSTFGAADALRVGYACSFLQRLVWTLTPKPALMALGLAAGAPGFGADAVAQQLALAYHPSEDPPRGELTAAFASLGTVGVLASSKVLAALFAWGRGVDWPGAPFAMGCGASLLALIAATASAKALDEQKLSRLQSGGDLAKAKFS